MEWGREEEEWKEKRGTLEGGGGGGRKVSTRETYDFTIIGF